MAKQTNNPNENKSGNQNPQVGNEIPLDTKKTNPYPMSGITPDEQPQRYDNLRKKFPDLIDSDLSGTREQVIQRISARKGMTPLDVQNILDGRV